MNLIQKGRIAKALLLCIIIPGFIVSNSIAAVSRKVVERARSLTVLITNESFMGSGRGTGILLDETHVLTCGHMVDSPKAELFVYTYPLGKVVKARPEWVDRADDLAVLTLDSSVPVTHKPVFQENVYDGESITVIGNGLGSMKWLVSNGVISGEDRGSLLTDANVNPGNSGGPWINAKGEIVGLTDWRIGPAADEHPFPGIVGGISAKTINHAIEGQKSMSALLSAVLGVGQ